MAKQALNVKLQQQQHYIPLALNRKGRMISPDFRGIRVLGASGRVGVDVLEVLFRPDASQDAYDGSRPDEEHSIVLVSADQ